MKFIGWITLFLLGIAVLNTIAYRIKVAEKIAFAFPIGFGAHSLLFFLADLLHFPLNSINSFIILELALCILFSTITLRKEKPRLSFGLFKKINFQPLPMVNFSYLFLIGVILVVTYILVRKSLYWPIAQFDSITGFDFIAKAIVHEGTLQSSLFDKENPLYSIRSLYPPLVPISFSFSYLIGHASSQIVVLVFFLCTLVSFYLLLQKTSTHLCAAFFTLLLVITPEYAAFATISSSNIPCTFYASIGMLCLYVWHTEQNKSYFILGAVFIALAVWTRTEAIIFAAGGGIMILMNSRINKKISLTLMLGIPSVIGLVLWQWYVKEILEAASAQPILSHFSWDYEKLSRMLNQVKLVTFSTQYFGATVLLFLAMLLINVKNILTQKDNLAVIISILITWMLYIGIFYLIDTDYLSNSMEGWIFSGYKRGLFFFFPLMLYYSATNKVSKKIFNEWLAL